MSLVPVFSAAPDHQRKTAINFRLPDVFFRSYFANLEHVFGNAHGVVIEGGYIGSYTMIFIGPDNTSAKWVTQGGYTLGIHYRYHFAERLDGPFLGAFLKYGSVSGTIIYSKGSSRFDGTQAQPQIGFSSLYQIIGINVGYRAIASSGITATARLGVGPVIGQYKYSTEDFAENREGFARIFNIFLNFDVEISLGYAI